MIARAAELGLRVLALTDHDTTAGLAAAVAAGERLGVEVIRGLELGISVSQGELHMLGYFIDPAAPALQATLTMLREGRRDRAGVMVRQLNQAGVPVTLDEVERLAGGEVVGRAHVARALVERGIAGSMNEAFDRFLAAGKPGYAPRPRLSAEEAIDVIHAAGGAAVLAHPFSVADLAETLPRLAAHGLDGLEVFYAAYDDLARARLAVLAAEHGLAPTGGSDFHGIPGPGEEGRALASAPVPLEAVTLLRQRAEKHQ